MRAPRVRAAASHPGGLGLGKSLPRGGGSVRGSVRQPGWALSEVSPRRPDQGCGGHISALSVFWCRPLWVRCPWWLLGLFCEKVKALPASGLSLPLPLRVLSVTVLLCPSTTPLVRESDLFTSTRSPFTLASPLPCFSPPFSRADLLVSAAKSLRLRFSVLPPALKKLLPGLRQLLADAFGGLR